ncbi:MAG: acyl-CoA thioesterase [Phycisphaeraceae bacterium]|nr:acyl-CoA thioesterase [Phycisphaeraceae bacterium]MCB9848097.1 acyl-CoA thioesterase [Phycisphaeraceae bacterium]
MNAPTPQVAVPTAGTLTVRVRYSECDPMGVAHHSVYALWFELGRTELLRGCGVTYADLEKAGVFLAVTRLETRYRAPARYDDALLLRTEVTGGGRARIDHAYELRRATAGGDGGDLLATATSTIACLDAQGRPCALPGWLVAQGG